MAKSQQNTERRNAQRFELDWDVAVKGTDQWCMTFDELGTLGNLSSFGAFVFLPRRVNLGERLEIQIRIPSKRNNWMRYTAEVVRLEPANVRAGIGVRFETAVPVFVIR